ncbi:MAG TPA: LytTR family DNA-binding domain-containing protein, partial [Polyangiales bacterium]|nr:LytTR family DNA-binding domain-containing protein [Polyangiales bacterium]
VHGPSGVAADGGGMRALVVDDEPPARRRLSRMLSQMGDMEVAAELGDGDDVLRWLETQSTPDILFLDVRMPGLDGVALAQRYVDLPPIVFVTAYDHYAIDAFDLNAVDYLLKPVRLERLVTAVERVRSRALLDRLAVGQALAAATSAASTGTSAIPRVVSGTRGVIQLFDAREITRFWASDKYTLFRAGGEDHLTEEPLSVLENRLAEYGFVRVHRAELVRADAIRALCNVESGHEVALSDGQVARVSRRALRTIKSALGLR